MKDPGARYWELYEAAGSDLGARAAVSWDELPEKVRLVTRVALIALLDEHREEVLLEVARAAQEQEEAEAKVEGFAARYQGRSR